MENAASFIWRDNYLIAANHASPGKLFGEKGLRALCYSTLSGKTGEEANLTGFTGAELLLHYQAEKLKIYETRNALDSDSGNEKSTSQDYSGRLFLELLQNAVDAMSDRPIGHKGLGFRVTTKFAESIRVHSGDLHFEFSREQARELVKNHTGGKIDDASMHILSVPASFDLSSEEPFIRDLIDIQKFDTVVVLKIKREDEAVMNALEQQWSEITCNPSTMLFFQSIGQITWVRETTTTTWDRHRHPNDSHRVELVVDGDPFEDWMVRGDAEKALIAARYESEALVPLLCHGAKHCPAR